MQNATSLHRKVCWAGASTRGWKSAGLWATCRAMQSPCARSEKGARKPPDHHMEASYSARSLLESVRPCGKLLRLTRLRRKVIIGLLHILYQLEIKGLV